MSLPVLSGRSSLAATFLFTDFSASPHQQPSQLVNPVWCCGQLTTLSSPQCLHATDLHVINPVMHIDYAGLDKPGLWKPDAQHPSSGHSGKTSFAMTVLREGFTPSREHGRRQRWYILRQLSYIGKWNLRSATKLVILEQARRGKITVKTFTYP